MGGRRKGREGGGISPDPVFPDDITVAYTVDNGASLERHGHVEDDGSEPRKRHPTVGRPFV